MRQLVFGLLFSLIGQTAKAQGTKTTLEFEYPELLVSPSASERLALEAKQENKNRWTNHWTIQSSAMTTLIAAFAAGSDPGRDPGDQNSNGKKGIKSAQMAGLAVGGGWLVTTSVLSAMYSPYRSGLVGLSKMPRTNKREMLAYERLSEEALAVPANIASVMKWGSLLSNAAVGAYILGESESDSTKVAGSLAVIASTLPLFFSHDWELTKSNQDLYKKRIYGPIGSGSFSLGTNNGLVAAVYSAQLKF